MRQRKPDRNKYFLLLIPVALLLLLSGCVSKSYWVWQHPDKQGELQLLQDQKECRELAQTEVAQINYFYDFYDMGYLYDFPYYDDSYRGRYHRPFFRGYHHYRFIREQDYFERFFRVCMKAKGWQQVKADPEAK